jgi:hypothetical protein
MQKTMHPLMYNIEIKLAAQHKTKIECRKVKANYNKTWFTEVAKRSLNVG